MVHLKKNRSVKISQATKYELCCYRCDEKYTGDLVCQFKCASLHIIGRQHTGYLYLHDIMFWGLEGLWASFTFTKKSH